MTAQDNPVTLVMLLSMAKLQQGQMPEGGYKKRWQTPEETYQQTHEAIRHIRDNGQKLDKVVLLYTDSLYLNSELPANKLIEKYQDITLRHRKEVHTLFSQDNEKLSVSDMLWNELVQGQIDYQGPRVKLKQFYQNNNDFRLAVHKDNPKHQNSEEQIKDKSASPSDMFVLEEAGLLDGLAKRYVLCDKINPDNDIIIGYPGPELESLNSIQQHGLKIFKGRPLYNNTKPVKTSWLNLSQKDKPEEKLIHINQPHLKSVTPQPKNNFFHISPKMRLAAASILLPVAAITAYLLPENPKKKMEPIILENDYQASVTWNSDNSGRKFKLTFRKDSADQKPQNWTASRIQFDENDPGRPLLFRDDVAFIYQTTAILSEKYKFKYSP